MGPVVGLALLLSACGGDDDAEHAVAANEEVAAPAAPVPVAGRPTPVTPSTALPPGGGIPGISAPPPANSVRPAADPVATEAGPQEAAAVLNRYFAAIADRRYDDAYRLWNGRGAASGQSARTFADSFADYADYRATIGTPGRIDAGAGQRYIAIPVRVTARRRDGTPVSLAGPVTLHRTGAIDGATAEQRAWRIQESGLKPRPATDHATPR